MGMGFGALAIIAGFMLMFLTIVGVSMLVIAKLVQNHVYANRYRKLLRQQAEAPSEAPGQRWRVVYKDNGRQRELILPAANEAEAMRAILQKGIEPRSIVTLEPSARLG